MQGACKKKNKKKNQQRSSFLTWNSRGSSGANWSWRTWWAWQSNSWWTLWNTNTDTCTHTDIHTHSKHVTNLFSRNDLTICSICILPTLRAANMGLAHSQDEFGRDNKKNQKIIQKWKCLNSHSSTYQHLWLCLELQVLLRKERDKHEFHFWERSVTSSSTLSYCSY